MSVFGIASYGVAAVVYGAMTAVLMANHPGGRSASWITTAALVSTAWAAVTAFLLIGDSPSPSAVLALDAVHALVWTGCVLSWLAPSPLRGRVYGRAMLLMVSAGFGAWSVLAAAFGLGGVFVAPLAMNLLGLLAVEQVFRNGTDAQRERLRLLCLGIGGLFVINVFVYSQASLLNGLMPILWEGRGLANAALVPLMMVAIKRQSEWEGELFVSRQVAFYTASLVAVGGYLLAMGAFGYVIRAVGGSWGVLLQTLFLVAALAILVYVLFSAGIRARAKVFLIKHFYRNKYDYRYEWLRLTAALSHTEDPRRLARSALAGIAEIVGSREGALWLCGEDGCYRPAATFADNAADGDDGVYEPDHPLVVFLRVKGWVIDSDEYAGAPDRYGSAFGDPSDGGLPPDSLVVPLDCQGRLQGFVILSRPSEVAALNFEDHDILKTAGRQVAVVLAQALAQEQLTATRQFEAVNKLVTFLMHDLKNVIAQQELVVANAQRFRDRPEFVDDAFATVKTSVERMRKVLDQLKSAAQSPLSRHRVDVSKVLMEVRSHCSDRQPVPRVAAASEAAVIDMDREKLISVLTHVIRNAQDATPDDGSIDVTLERADGALAITITDTGKGMDARFIRDRLFKPFDSTKGAKGMGIGAYQVRETVRMAGGDVEVHSEVGAGTRFRIVLPVIPASETAAA